MSDSTLHWYVVIYCLGYDVTMGSFEGAKVCELVGLYILHILITKYGKNLNGLHRDDG